MLKSLFGFTTYRAINLIFPIVTLPIISIYVDNHTLGCFFILQTFSFWVSLIIDFGFIRTGVVDYIESNNKKKTFSDIIQAQFFIFIFLIIITIAINVFVDINSTSIIFILFTGLVQGITPKWYYQATSRMLRLSFFESTSKVIGLFFMLLVFHYDILHGIYSLITSYIVINIFMFLFVLVDCKCLLTKKTFYLSTSIFQQLKVSSHVFYMRVVGNIYLNGNILLLSFLSPPETIAIYGICERIVKAISSISTSFGEVVFPLSVRNKSISLQKNMIISIFFPLPIVIITLLLSSHIIYFLNNSWIELGIKNIIFTSPLFFSLSTILSLGYFVSKKMYSLDLFIQIIIAIVSLITTFISFYLAPINYPYYAFFLSSVISFLVYFIFFLKVSINV